MADELAKIIANKPLKELSDRLQTVAMMALTEDNAVEVAATLLRVAGVIMTAPEVMHMTDADKSRFIMMNVMDGYAQTLKELAVRAGKAAQAAGKMN